MLDPANYTPWYDVALCDELRNLGVNVTLLTSRYSYETSTDYSREYTEEHFHTLAGSLKLKGVARRVVAGLEHPLDWLNVMRKLSLIKRPKIVHSQWLPVPNVDLAFLRFIKRRGAVLVHTVHNLVPYKESRGGATSFRQLYLLCDCLIVHTRATADGLVSEFGVSRSKIRHIPMGSIGREYPLMAQDVARRSLGLDLADRLILFFGSLRQEKGLQHLIAALPRIVELCPNAKLIIAGRPEGISQLQVESMLAQTGLARDRFITRLVYIPSVDVPAYFHAADIVAYPYLKVDQSAALVLGLTLGKAAVVTDVGGLPDLVQDGVNGFVVRSGDVLALANAIGGAMCHPEQVREMGIRAGNSATREFRWAESATETLKAYQFALTTGRDHRLQ